MTKYERCMIEAEKLRAKGRRARDHKESLSLMRQADAIEKKARSMSVAEGEEEVE